MILYTMMPQELIYQTDIQDYERVTQINYDGIPLVVEKTDDYNYRVLRVLSTDPKHYLDSRCTPGSMISFI